MCKTPTTAILRETALIANRGVAAVFKLPDYLNRAVTALKRKHGLLVCSTAQYSTAAQNKRH